MFPLLKNPGYTSTKYAFANLCSPFIGIQLNLFTIATLAWRQRKKVIVVRGDHCREMAASGDSTVQLLILAIHLITI